MSYKTNWYVTFNSTALTGATHLAVLNWLSLHVRNNWYGARLKLLTYQTRWTCIDGQFSLHTTKRCKTSRLEAQTFLLAELRSFAEDNEFAFASDSSGEWAITGNDGYHTQLNLVGGGR